MRVAKLSCVVKLISYQSLLPRKLYYTAAGVYHMKAKPVYTCGRLHKQRKPDLSAKSAATRVVVEAVLK
eukprot:1892021-Prymnesium_polylepis.2